MRTPGTLIVASTLAASLLAIAAPIALAVVLRARGYRWRWWLLGGVGFLAGQLLAHAAAACTIGPLLAVFPWSGPRVGGWTAAYLFACLAAVAEETARLAVSQAVLPGFDRKGKPASPALMLGAGHGGLESLAIGLLLAAGGAAYFLVVDTPLQLPRFQEMVFDEARRQLSPLAGWEPLLFAWERVVMLPVHLALALMVWRSAAGRPAWWLLAAALHLLVDVSVLGVLQISAAAWPLSTAFVLATLVATGYSAGAIVLVKRLA